MKTPLVKKSAKSNRERRVLLGLIEHYIKTGKPVGSNTLKETGFEDLSSATIRNYFASLEEDGYLTQQHTSGGRLPTPLAFRLYAKEHENYSIKEEIQPFKYIKNHEGKEIATLLQQAAETLSISTQSAVFLSAPRFDHDFVNDLKLVTLDHHRCLCIIITDFGVIQTEILPVEKKLSQLSTMRMEAYFHWRLTGHGKPENMTEEEEKLAQSFYNELMVRYVVGYSTFTEEEIYRTGFSRLLIYPDFFDPNALATSLSLFENAQSMRRLLRESAKANKLKYWIGDDLIPYSTNPICSVITIPYCINNKPVGAVGILGPVRMPYRELFGILREFSESVSDALTRNIYKYKISFRQPQSDTFFLPQEESHLIGETRTILLENKS